MYYLVFVFKLLLQHLADLITANPNEKG